MKILENKIALVTGASRGAGKGIALALGEAGATIYITGRTGSRNDLAETVMGEILPGTLEQTREEILHVGGRCVALTCDHRDDDQVRYVFRRIRDDQGRLDILVNNAYQLHDSTNEGQRFWEAPLEAWDSQQIVGLRSVYVASVYAAQMMVPSRRGVIVNISSPAAAGYIQTTAYGVIKAALDRLSGDMAHELRPHNVASISIWPGAIATERVKTMVNKSTAPLHGAKDETPVHVGRGVAALAGDPDIMSKSGAVFTTADLGLEYGFTDIDGSRPPNARDTFWPPPPPPIYRDLQPQRLGLPKVRA